MGTVSPAMEGVSSAPPPLWACGPVGLWPPPLAVRNLAPAVDILGVRPVRPGLGFGIPG